MSDEQPTSGTNTNPATDVHAPRQAAPVMDVVPPPTQSSAEPVVVDAPPEDTGIPAMSDDMAEQIAADAKPTETPSPSPAPADAPADSKPATADSAPSSAVHNEIEKQKNVPAEVKLPKVRNPGRTAAVATIVATIFLAVLAVFAFMSTQK